MKNIFKALLITLFLFYSNIINASVGEGVSPVGTLNSLKITVTSPNGGEVWDAGSFQTIVWDGPTRFITNVKIEYSADSGATWTDVNAFTPSANLSYRWFVPNTPSKTCIIKISDPLSLYGFINDESDAVFTIDSLSSIQIDSLTVMGDDITEISDKKYSVTGNVSINGILKFSGGVVVDLNNLSVAGNGLIYLDGIPVLQKVNLYEGNFNFNVKDAVLKGILDKANNLFKMGNLPVELSNIELIPDGIRIEGKLIFPEIMGNFGAEITTLQITSTNGVGLIGGVHINSISFSGFKLENLIFNFNTIENNFEGSGTLVTRPLDINAGVLITQGRLDSIGVWVVLGRPIPLGATGLSLSEGGGYIAQISHPPMKLALGITLVPTAQGSFDVVKFNHLTMIYTFGRRLEGKGNLSIFGNSLARAGLVITDRRVAFYGDVNISNVLLGHGDAAITRKYNGRLDFTGNLSAKLQIPQYDKFPFDIIGKIVTLPYTVASTKNHIKNTHIWGKVSLSRIFSVTYDLRWVNSSVKTKFGTKFHIWNNLLTSSSKLNIAAKNSLDRFEGKSVIIGPNELNESLKIINNSLEQYFTISKSTPLFIIRLKGNSDTPVYSVTLPNGTVVDKNNVRNFNNIEFYEDNVSRKGFYLLQNPQVGQYKLTISNVNDYFLDLYGSDASPDIKIQQINQNGSDVEIKWNDFDPGHNAKVSLYYDNNNYNADGVLITDEINAGDNADSFTWNTEGLETGSYYIYAVIEDSSSGPVISYYDSPLRIVSAVSPAAPQNLEYSITDTSVALNWTRPLDGKYKYNVYYSTQGNVDYSSASFNLGDTASFEFTNFIPGKEYKFAVTAIDGQYNESGLSNVITVNYISATQNNSPVILTQEFPSTAFTNQQLNYTINVFDSDNDELTFITQNAPEGLTIDNAGQLSWTPTVQQIGNNLVVFKVDDGHGLSDSASFRINVLDSLASRGSVYLNKPYYYGFSEMPVVTIQDANLNLSPSQVDSQLVHIYSGMDSNGIDLTARETDANSGLFTALLKLDDTNSGVNTLAVSGKDSITAVYIDQFPQDTLISVSYFVDTLTTTVGNDFTVNPNIYRLFNAYPNPFNPTTTIQYYIPENAHVTISIYNELGQLVNKLIDEEAVKGNHIVKWNGRNQSGSVVTSGIYFYRFRAEGIKGAKIISKKIILIK